MKQVKFYLMAAIVLSSCSKAPEAPRTSYEILEIQPQSVIEQMPLSATLEGLTDVFVSPRVNGHLMQKCVEEGQHVKAGQVLFIIDNRQALLDVNTAKANLAAAEAELSTAKLEYESQQNLFDKGITSQYILSTAANRVQTAEASLQQAQAALASAELNLSYHTITSPIDGIVGTLPNNVGEMISVNTVLTTISGTQEMIAKFSITENALNTLNDLGGSVESVLRQLPEVALRLKDGKEYPYKGHIITISGIVNRVTGAVSCRAQFPNPDGYLYSGIQGAVIVPFQYDSVVVIPESAVVRLQNKNIVYKLNPDSTASCVLVEGESLNTGNQFSVSSGLEFGDKIVAVGAANLVDGQQVIF